MNQKQTQMIAYWAMFVALLLLLTFTSIGFLPIGPVKATIVHLPVLLMGLCFGVKEGLIAGLLFGLASLVNNTFNPGLVSFAFTPFIEIAGISGGYQSLVICFIPRIVLGGLSGVIGCKIESRRITALLVFILCMIYSVSVLGLIVIFYSDLYAKALNIAKGSVVGVMVTTLSSQSLVEAITATLFIYLIYPYIRKVRKI